MILPSESPKQVISVCVKVIGADERETMHSAFVAGQPLPSVTVTL